MLEFSNSTVCITLNYLLKIKQRCIVNTNLMLKSNLLLVLFSNISYTYIIGTADINRNIYSAFEIILKTYSNDQALL